MQESEESMNSQTPYCSQCNNECTVVELRSYEETEQFGNVRTHENIYEESDCCGDDVYYITSNGDNHNEL